MSACFDIERGGYTTESCLALLVILAILSTTHTLAFRPRSPRARDMVTRSTSKKRWKPTVKPL